MTYSAGKHPNKAVVSSIWLFQVIETLGRENVKLNKSQVTEMLELLRQEDVIQEEEKRREKEEKENTKQGTEQQQQQQQQ